MSHLSTQDSHADESKCTPLNPTAVVNLEKPQRSMKVRWEEPECRPEYYEVKAIPETGKHKTRKCEDTEMIFPRLKTFTKYHFQISAVFDEERRNCYTNKVRTHSRLDQPVPAQFQHLSGTSINQSHASITNTTQLMNARPDSFDKVENVRMEMDTVEDQEMAIVKWDHPSFSGFYDDYEIIEYHVEVFNLSTQVFSDHFKYKTPFTDKFEVNLGEEYVIKIHTKYEELDTERRLTSHSETVAYSRPKYPIIDWNVDGNNLNITWGSSIGAEKYRFALLKESNKKVIKTEEDEKGFRNISFKIDLDVFWGTEYIVNVSAIGKRLSSMTTKTILIDNKWSPKLPQVTLNEANLQHSVDIMWKKPDRDPHHYIVQTMDSSLKKEVLGDTRCTIERLKAGQKYRFNIFAVHTEKLEADYRCTTEEISTNPLPEYQIETLEVTPSHFSPESELRITWGKLDEALKYRIRVVAEDFLIEDITECNYYTARGLKPHTEYFVGVSPGNAKGFGKELTRSQKTAITAPRNVLTTSRGSDHVMVEWEGHQSKYKVRLHDAENSTLLQRALVEGATSHNFKGLEGNKRYYVDVEAIQSRALRRNQKSGEILTVPSAKEIETVSLLEREGSISTDVCLKWQKDEGSLLYDVEVRTDGKVENLLRVEEVNFHEYRCLKAGNLYEFRLRVVNTAGCGRWSKPVPFQLENPQPPNKIKVVLDKEKPWRIARITWDRPENVPSFSIHICPEVLKDWVQEENSYRFELGEPNKTYEISILAKHKNRVLSAKETKKSFKMGDIPSPLHILATPDTDDPWHASHLSWPEVKGVDVYKICVIGQESANIIQEKTLYKLEGEPGKTFKVRIHPGEKGGYFSERFIETSVSFEKIPEVDQNNLAAVLDDDDKTVNLSWKKPNGIDHFKIEWVAEKMLGYSSSDIEKGSFRCQNDSTQIVPKFCNTLIVEICSVGGGETGSAILKSFKLRPWIRQHSYHHNSLYDRTLTMTISSDMEVDKTAIRARGQSSSDDVIVREFEHLPRCCGEIRIDGLKYGETYDISAIVQCGNVCSEETTLSSRKIEYGKVENLRIVDHQEDTIEITWDEPEIKPSHYNVDVSGLLTPDNHSAEIKENKFRTPKLVLGLCHWISVRPFTGQVRALLKFRTAPGKPGAPRLLCCHSSFQVDITWGEAPLADEYHIYLHEMGKDTCDMRHSSHGLNCTVGGLKKGVKYQVTVRGKNEAGLGKISDTLEFRTEFNGEETAEIVKALSKKMFKSKLPTRFLKPTMKYLNGGEITLDQFIGKKSGDASVIVGPPKSGLTSLCYYIANEFCSESVVFCIPSSKGILGSAQQLLGAHLKSLKIHLSENEILKFFSWMEENSQQCVFIIDDFEVGSSTAVHCVPSQGPVSQSVFMQQIFIRTYFPSSKIFATAPPSSRPFMEGFGVMEVARLLSYNSGTAPCPVSPTLSSSAETCFTLANLKNRRGIDFNSPASLYLHVYSELYEDEAKKAALARDIEYCSEAYMLRMIPTADFESLSPYKKFVLAMHGMFRFNELGFHQTLEKRRPHSEFTLLFFGLLNVHNSKLAFPLLMPSSVESAGKRFHCIKENVRNTSSQEILRQIGKM